MLLTYYTLRALVEEWKDTFEGSDIADAFSYHRDELVLGIARPEATWSLYISVRSDMRYLFRAPGYARPRRNVTTLFPDLLNRQIKSVDISYRDRYLFLSLADGKKLQIQLFGPRPNVFLVDASGRILDAFRQGKKWQGERAPRPRPAPEIDQIDLFIARWNQCTRNTLAQRLACAWPLFDRVLAREVLFRAGVSETTQVSEQVLGKIFAIAQEVEQELLRPVPRIYWGEERKPEVFSLIPLKHLSGVREERFDMVDDAVRVYVRALLSWRRFQALKEPIEQALERAAERLTRQLERIEKEQAKKSRADQYERWGHLLMTFAHQIPPGSSEAIVQDILGEGEEVHVPLDPALSVVENAQRYYQKAKEVREARAHAAERLHAVRETLEEVNQARKALASLHTIDELKTFQKTYQSMLAYLAGKHITSEQARPYRQFELEGGYEVWVGRHARENEQLTFHEARKYDYWLHARGVPGAHVILRVPNRNQKPPRRILEMAAAIAAYFSEARHSSLVPVQVAQRKYVRKLRRGAPGAVKVEREEVLLVEPAIPPRLRGKPV